MNRSETDSPALDCVMARLSTDPIKRDTMQRDCLSLDGAKKTAAFLRKHDAALADELTDEQLAGLLMHHAKQSVGVFANVIDFAK